MSTEKDKERTIPAIVLSQPGALGISVFLLGGTARSGSSGTFGTAMGQHAPVTLILVTKRSRGFKPQQQNITDSQQSLGNVSRIFSHSTNLC